MDKRKEKELWDIAIAIIVVLLFGGFIISFLLPDSMRWFQSEPSVEIQADTVFVEDVRYVRMSDDEVFETPIEKEIVAYEESLEIEEVPTYYQDKNGTLNQNPSSVVAKFGQEDLEENELVTLEKIVEVDPYQKPIIREFKALKDTLDVDDYIPTQINNSDSENTNLDCIIMIGLFGNQKNVQRLKERLEDELYEVWTVDESGATRLGVYVDCMDQKRSSILNNIRKNYAPDANMLQRK